MKFKSRTGKTLADQNVLTDLGKGTKDAIGGSSSFFGNFIVGIFNYFIGIGAFLSRCFLRTRLGERTYGLITMVSVYFVIWFMFMFPKAYEAAQTNFFQFPKTETPIKEVLNFLMTFYYLIFYLIIDPEKLKTVIPDLSDQVNIFIAIILIIGIGHFIELYTRKRRKEIVHSYYRGNSWLFGWMEGQSFLGSEMKLTVVWMIVEPIFIVFLSILLDYLGFKDVATILRVSAICLFIEELRVYQENRRFTLDMIDGQLDAAFAQELQEEYKENIDTNTQTENQKSYIATSNSSANADLLVEGSDSPFRATIL